MLVLIKPVIRRKWNLARYEKFLDHRNRMLTRLGDGLNSSGPERAEEGNFRILSSLVLFKESIPFS